MKRFTAIALALVAAAAVLPVHAEPDKEGCKDHPLFNRMPGYYIQSCQHLDFDQARFGYGPGRGEKIETVEGPVTYLLYFQKGSKVASPLQVARNFQNAVKAAGGEVMGEYNGGGGVAKFQGGGNSGNSRYSSTMRLKKSGKEIWIAEGADTAGDFGWYDLLIAERQAMEQAIAANDLLDQINKNGFIALYFNFDTGKATLKADAASQLDQIAQMLKSNASLKLEVAGHTDNVGTPDSNQKLSEARANSVMQALVKRGVAANRLTAKGFGSSSPLADNRSEDGRAKNRRVELVKK